LSEEDTLTTDLPYTVSDRTGKLTTRVGAGTAIGTRNATSIRVATPYAVAEMALEPRTQALVANELLKRLPTAKGVQTTVQDGRSTIAVDNARVYQALTEGEAQRNLNFALANLESYLYWERKGRAEKIEREANLKRAEERKAKELADAKKAAEEATRLSKKALAIYNAVNSTNYVRFPVLMGSTQLQKWLDVAREAEKVASLNALTVPTLRDLYPSFSGGPMFANGGYVNRTGY